ncbi:MAG: cobalamin-dependent protein [Phycisphaerales bacterium]|nr:cobalamin-dependent protein [Phycisphaerales bacterium]|tara:strand:- start:352730 stop:353455 length:726 start_codon:yes stop_codon:yes gene_type:complete
MSVHVLSERLFEALIEGNRSQARSIVNEQLSEGVTPELMLTDLFWPTYEMIDKLHREDQISALAYNLSTRLFRVLVDQTSRALIASSNADPVNRSVFACCGTCEGSELGAQMAVDLLEAAGFGVRFAGGGVPLDEVRQTVQESKPDVLLMFCSNPADLPDIRVMIDSLHEIGACPNTQIVVGGGVFNRAEGLAEEIGADLWASHPLELVDAMIDDAEIRATPAQRTVGRTRKAPTPAAKAA